MRFAARRSVRWIAVVTGLCGLLLSLASPAHALRETDPDCGPVTAALDHARATLDATTPIPVEQHCAFCHWMRALSGAAPNAEIAPVPGFTACAIAVSRDDRSVDVALLDLKPSRAPPAIAVS
ncbi:MAG TPA: hypothetical protein VG736_13340 [Vicinamibacterales bacterium]|jgi:hypothetical protein|nr:hypothetical protein [Vicinamibacterales bacterium]